MRDVAHLQQRPKTPGVEYNHPPLVLPACHPNTQANCLIFKMIMNNFSSQRKDIQLMNVVFQRLFPPINVQTVTMSNYYMTELICLQGTTGGLPKSCARKL